MARDRISLKLVGGAKLDRVLAKLDPNVSSRIVNASIKKAGEAARDVVEKSIPVSRDGTSGNRKYKSRNHNKGTLRRALKFSLKSRARPNPNVFIASIYIQDGVGVPDEDGWYSHMVMKGRKGKKRPSGRGSAKGLNKDNYMDRGSKKATPVYKRTMKAELLNKLTRAHRKMIKNALRGL